MEDVGDYNERESWIGTNENVKERLAKSGRGRSSERFYHARTLWASVAETDSRPSLLESFSEEHLEDRFDR